MTSLGAITPVLRMFDEAKAKEFYRDFLGFKLDFEHRFGANFPLYMGLSRSGCVLHLSEHHGDACPGAAIRIATSDVDALCKELSAKSYRYAKPGGAAQTPRGTKEVTIDDPFGNKLTFHQEL